MVEYLNYMILDDHGWTIDDGTELFEKAKEADLSDENYGTLDANKDEYILETAGAAGYDWPFLCRAGYASVALQFSSRVKSRWTCNKSSSKKKEVREASDSPVSVHQYQPRSRSSTMPSTRLLTEPRDLRREHPRRIRSGYLYWKFEYVAEWEELPQDENTGN